jgi:hypothetical protein
MISKIIELPYNPEVLPVFASLLEEGNVIILRDVLSIKEFRRHLIELSCAYGDADEVRNELLQFYETGDLPSAQTIYALRCGIQIARSSRLLSQYLAPLVDKMGFFPSILLDGGISRLVLPRELINKIRRTDQYDPVDFLRDRADGPTETFMRGAANIHRDFNRVHHLFQCNMWFPLHNADTDEVLRIWPELYRSQILDMDATPDNLRRLGSPVDYKLSFGDVIIFHGEHLHTSPAKVHGEPDYRRHSFDFRIATRCGDDNKGYRYNFCNLNNFITSGNSNLPALVGNLSCNFMERFREKLDSANYYFLALENRIDLLEKDVDDILNIFLHLPFAEDRYLMLVKKALAMGMHETAIKAAEQIKICSTHFFWLLRCGEAFERLEMNDTAQTLYRRCYEILSEFSPQNTMPLIYVNGSNELLMEEALNIVRLKLN